MIARDLKQHTAPHHARLDGMMSAWLEASSRASYAELIGRLYGFYAPVEAALRHMPPHLAEPLALERRRKSALLADDLGALGGPPAAQLPLCADLPDLGDEARMLGCLYVLEGATLGGQIILRQHGPRLQVSQERGARFFASYGAEVGPMWRAFQDTLRAFDAEHPSARPAVLSAAADTFAGFEAWVFRGPAAHAPAT